jgi:hypothetical protein
MSPRFDLYSAIHKALRNYMGAALLQLGRLDVTDELEVHACGATLLGLIDWLEHHLAIEERFVHGALAERQTTPLLSSLRRDHAEHERSFSLLRQDVAVLVGSLGDDAEARRARTHHLYLSLSRFIGDNLVHMANEETELNPLLWAAFTDDDLLGIYGRILASERPEQLELSVRWLLPAVEPDERVRIVGGARAAMPAPVFEQLLPQVRSVLSARDYDKLVDALGLATEA